MTRKEKIKKNFESLGYDMSREGIVKKIKNDFIGFIVGTSILLIFGFTYYTFVVHYGEEVVENFMKWFLLGLVILFVTIGHIKLIGHLTRYSRIRGFNEVFGVLITTFPTIIVVSTVYLCFKGYLAWWRYSVDKQL